MQEGETAEKSTLHNDLVEASTKLHTGRAIICSKIGEMEEAGGYLDYNVDTIVEYARVYLGIEGRELREMRRVGKALRELPRMKEAFDEGAVGWAKVKAMVTVATAETEAEWIERATENNARMIEQLVARTKKGDEPPHPEDGLAPRAGRVKIVFEVDASEALLIRKAIITEAQRAGEDDIKNIDEGAILADMARSKLVEAAHDKAAPAPRDAYQVNVFECSSCRKMTHAGHDEPFEVSRAMQEEIACCAATIDLTPGEDQGTLSHKVPPRVQRVVRARANFRCETRAARTSSGRTSTTRRPAAPEAPITPLNLCCFAHSITAACTPGT